MLSDQLKTKMQNPSANLRTEEAMKATIEHFIRKDVAEEDFDVGDVIEEFVVQMARHGMRYVRKDLAYLALDQIAEKDSSQP